jgi:hypothetical protein
MGFKLISKKNMGIFTTLILVVLLSQSRLFTLLTDMPLGRMVLLALIIFISYVSKMLGLLAVLFIILAFNYHDGNVVQSYNFEGFSNINADVQGAAKINVKDKNVSKEGFCMSDRESTILRGKQSNAIPVFNNSREQGDDISPSDKSVFSSSFYSF